MRPTRVDMEWFDGRWEGADRRQEMRRQWERMLNLALYLDKQEQIFLETATEQCFRVSRLSRLTGRTPGSLRWQIKEIARRLFGRELRAMVEQPEAFSRLEKACLLEHLIRKRPLRRVASELGVSVYEVRKNIVAGRCKVQKLISVNSEQLPVEEGGGHVCL